MTEQALSSTRYFMGTPAAKRTVLVLASVLSLGMLLLGGCSKGPAPAAPATADQPAASRAATAQSTTPPPEAAPAPPAPKQYVVPKGTTLAVRMEQAVSARNNDVGDSFSGSLAQPVVVHGVTVLHAGTRVTGTVVAAKGQGRFKGAGDLAIDLRRVGNYSVTTASYEKTESGKGKRTAGLIGGGGGGGALIGGLAGGGKGALIGGLLGAGAGTAGAGLTGSRDVSIPAESVVIFTLMKPVTVEERH